MNIAFGNSHLSKKNSNIRFGYNVVVDVGASTQEGSLKLSVLTKNNEVVKKELGVLNTESKYFIDNDHFNRLIVDKISDSLDPKTLNQIKEKDPSDKHLEGVALLVPSYVDKNQVAQRFTKFKTLDNSYLKNVEFSSIKDKLIKKGINVSENFNLKVFRDIVGILVGVSEKMSKNNSLQVGQFFSVLTTGGGTATGDIKVFNPKKPLIELACNYEVISDNDMGHLAKYGASAPTFVNNICSKLSLNDKETETLVKYGCVKELVAQKDITITSKFRQRNIEIANSLVNSGIYKYKDSNFQDSNNINLIFNAGKKADTDKAINHAIDEYANGLTILAVKKINCGSNGMILTGTMCNNINQLCQNRYSKNLCQIINDKIEERVKDTSLKTEKDANDFHVVCNNEFNFNDNSDCGNRIFKTNYMPNSLDRNNWITVDLE